MLSVRNECFLVYFYGFLPGEGWKTCCIVVRNFTQRLVIATASRFTSTDQFKEIIHQFHEQKKKLNAQLISFSPAHKPDETHHHSVMSTTPNALNYSNASEKTQTCTNISIGAANEREK
jgi:hypothetical protein